ncbi:MAG: hypothetical protein C0518_08745 [Opitutus sp.]|nr:hypothetical protein [Opitutus sp.]
MNDPAADNSRIPVGKFGWLVVAAVVAAPFLFFALVTPKEKPVSEPTKIELPPSKLEAVGLRENRDWDGLPEIFAVWAPRGHWQNDRTRFSYWNPGTESHSYFFEAQRTREGFRFKEIKEPRDEGFEWDRDADPDSLLRLYLPLKSRWHDPVQPVKESTDGRPSAPLRPKNP